MKRGRPQATDKRLTVVVRLPASLIASLPVKGKGALIEAALRQYLESST